MSDVLTPAQVAELRAKVQSKLLAKPQPPAAPAALPHVGRGYLNRAAGRSIADYVRRHCPPARFATDRWQGHTLASLQQLDAKRARLHGVRPRLVAAAARGLEWAAARRASVGGRAARGGAVAWGTGALAS